MREDADRVVGTWARWERPERSERAIAAGLPHRYRGALLLLTSDAAPENRVVATKELTSVADGEPGYRCWNTNGDLVELRESQLVAPDEAWLLKAIEDGPPRTPQARARWYEVLRGAYVWVIQAYRPPADFPYRSYELLLFLTYRMGRGIESKTLKEISSGPLPAFSSLERAEAFGRDRQRQFVAGRVPVIVACRLAEIFGDSESIVINHSANGPQAVVDRATYRLLGDSVVGYDLRLRALPAGGLDPSWIGPMSSAAAADSDIVEAYAWRTAAPRSAWGESPTGTVADLPADSIGLVLTDGQDRTAFDRVRTSLRDRATALGLPAGHRYLCVWLQPGSPHAFDPRHVVTIKRKSSSRSLQPPALPSPSGSLAVSTRNVVQNLMDLRGGSHGESVESFAAAHPFAGRGQQMYVVRAGTTWAPFIVITGSSWGMSGRVEHSGDTHALSRLTVAEDELVPPDERLVATAVQAAADGGEPRGSTIATLRDGYAWILLPPQDDPLRRLVRWIGLGWILGTDLQRAYVTRAAAIEALAALPGSRVVERIPIAALAYLAPHGVELLASPTGPRLHLTTADLTDLRQMVPLERIPGAPTQAQVRAGASEPEFPEAPDLGHVSLLA